MAKKRAATRAEAPAGGRESARIHLGSIPIDFVIERKPGSKIAWVGVRYGGFEVEGNVLVEELDRLAYVLIPSGTVRS